MAANSANPNHLSGAAVRILMISDVYFPRINGVSTSIQTFRHHLMAQGHHVTLIVPDYGDNSQDDEDIIRIPARYLPMDPEDRMMKGGRIKRLLHQLAPQHFDILHIQTPFVAHYLGMWLARKLQIPAVETYHTYFEEYLYHYVPFLPKAWMKFAARWFTRSECNNVNAIIVPSSPMRDVLADYGVKSHMEIIPTGIDANYFKPADGASFRQQLGIDAGKPLLVYVGRVAHEKNIDFILDVVSRVKQSIDDIVLVIAGEGPAHNHLKKRSHKMQLDRNVIFVGYLDRSTRLLDCYNAGDIFIFASRTETQGLVLLEAMAQGTPVVSTAILGTRDILRHNKGALVASEDLADFSDKVIQLMRNNEQRQHLASEAREFAETWSAPAMAGKMAEFYESVCQKHGLADPVLPEQSV
jgi:glycosyltransferase involved in cell wall biosynthesis